jgi:hypothetical protein
MVALAVRLIARLIRLVAVVASLLVVVGAAFFAVELASQTTDRQRERLEPSLEPVPTAADERDREARHGGFREAVDDANDVLLAPFAGVFKAGDIWVRRIVAAVLALLLYGVALSLLAGFVRRG